MRIRWDDLGHEKYEDMVTVLLSRLHPDAQRIDGKGGDGGRDMQILHGQDDKISHAFELKSFTGRMTTGRRKQVARSLCRATGLRPARWTLVVPIDPTPSEDAWFRDLGSNYCFPITWHGKTWLDEKMSAFPDIRRYFLEGADNELIRSLKELQKEEARVNDVQDAVGRLRNLRERLNEIDPHYRYELSTGKFVPDRCPPGVVFSVGFCDVRVDVYSKYSGAIQDSPITVKAKFALQPGDEGVLDALNYGLEATMPSRLIKSLEINAPSGLGGSFAGGEMRILPASIVLEEPVILTLDIIDRDRLLASYPVHLTERTGGPRGAILNGADSTGWLQVSLKVSKADKKLETKFRLNPKPAMPAALVPLFRWLGACQPPNYIEMRWPDGSKSSGEMRSPHSIDASLVNVVEALAFLQEASRMYWNMPYSFTREEESEIVMAARLLKGERVEFRWKSFSFSLKRLESAAKELLEGSPRAFLIDQDTWLALEGRELPIGRVRTHIESARIADPKAAQQALASELVAPLVLVPGDSDKGQHELLPKPD